MTSRKMLKLVRSFMVAVAIILIWRGTWYLLDVIDYYFFNGNHIFTAIGGLISGIAILYLPDHDLKELAKL